MEHFIKIGTVNQLNRAPKKLKGGLLAKCTRRTQYGHPLRGFQRQAGRHDFTPDGRHVLAFERPGVGSLDFFDDLGHAVGPEEWGAVQFFNFAHLFGHAGAAVQQRQHVRVNGIDLDAQVCQARQIWSSCRGVFHSMFC